MDGHADVVAAEAVRLGVEGLCNVADELGVLVGAERGKGGDIRGRETSVPAASLGAAATASSVAVSGLCQYRGWDREAAGMCD